MVIMPRSVLVMPSAWHDHGMVVMCSNSGTLRMEPFINAITSNFVVSICMFHRKIDYFSNLSNLKTSKIVTDAPIAIPNNAEVRKP